MSYLNIRIFLLFGIGLLGASALYARDDAVPTGPYLSGAAAGMADAYLPLCQDTACGLYTNPAMLSKMRWGLEPVNLQGNINSDYLGAGTGAYKIFNLGTYEAVIQEFPQFFPSMEVQAVPNFSMFGFGFGFLYSSRFSAKYNDNGTVRYRTHYQMIPSVGYGASFAKGIVRIGYSFQWVTRMRGEVLEANYPLNYTKDIQKGGGYSHNFGYALTLPYEGLPAVNIVVRNIGKLKYDKRMMVDLAGDSTEILADEPMTIDTSFSMQPKLGGGIQFAWVFLYRDIMNQVKVNLLTKFASGIEVSLRDTVFFRGGFGSGYPAGGLGIRAKKGEVSVAYFSEEKTSRFRDEQDARFLAQLSMRIF